MWLHAPSLVLLLVVGDRALRVVFLIFITEFLLNVERLRGQILGTLLSYVLRQALRVNVMKLLMVDKHLCRQAF